MRYIQNYDTLAINDNRKVVLELIETAFSSITPEVIFSTAFSLENKKIKLEEYAFDLSKFERIHLIGFGKGSALMCKILEEKLGDLMTDGMVIDVVDQTFSKLAFTKGTHPLPSQENFDFTKRVIEKYSKLTEKDLIIITTCGGGSVLFEQPHSFDLNKMIEVNKTLLHSGATISEMNVIRKHLSKVKGGGLAKILFPASVINLVFSDVPGNDLSVIASGPLVKDPTTIQDAMNVLKKYTLTDHLKLSEDNFLETPKDDKYFNTVHNILMLSNITALKAMQKKANELGFQAEIFTDRLQGDAKETGKYLLEKAKPGQILLAGGETTVKVTGSGKGGRNQALALSSLPYLTEGTVLVSFDSDGWDFYGFAGAIVDTETVKKTTERHLDAKIFLDNDNSYEFFKKTGDGILTGKQESNVSDLMIIFKR